MLYQNSYGTFFLKITAAIANVITAAKRICSRDSRFAAFLLIIIWRNTTTIIEDTIVAETDLRIMPMINGQTDSLVHTMAAVTAAGIHVCNQDISNVPSNISK